MAIIKSSTDHLTLNADGASKEVKIQRNGTQVLATTSTGIDVTGVTTTDGLTSSGNITFDNGNSSVSIKSDGADGSYIQFGSNEYLRFLYDNGASESIRLIDGGGITFNGDTAAANALDDYEEGTWTPANTYIAITNEVTARYVKIGNMVTVWGNITWASSPADVSQTGGKIQGLPYTPLGGDHPWVASWWQNTSTGSIRVDSGNTNYDFMVNASTELVIYNRPSSRVAQRQQVSGTHMKFQATYQVA
jgi:hypothetical protein